MQSKLLLASTAIALVLSPINFSITASKGVASGKAYAQTTAPTDEEAAKVKLEEEAKAAAAEAAEAEAAKAAEAEAAKAAEAEAAKAAEAEAAKAAEAEAAKAAEAEAAKAAEAEAAKAADEEAAKAAQAEAAKAAEAEAAKAAEAEANKAAEAAKAAEAEAPKTEEAPKAVEAQPKKADKKADRKEKRKSADTTAAEEKPAPDAAPAATTAEEKPVIEAAPETTTADPAKQPETTTETQTQPAAATETAAEAPPTPSAEAPVAENIIAEPIKEQIQKAEEVPTAVVPDDVTAGQRQELKAAETKRRKKAKDNREELIGAAAVGVAIGALLPVLGGTVVEDQGDRFVVERNGEYYVRKDDSALFRDRARDVTYEKLRGGRTLETVYRENGSRVETIRDPGGYVLRRVKINREGREIVLFDSRDINDARRVNYDETLPPIRLTIPRDEYVVSGGRADRRSLAEIFAAPPVEEVESQYSLRDVRENVRVRDIVRSVDLDTINFDSGSFTVRNSQVPYLADVAGGILDEVEANPNAVFLIEGHTDAVGSEVSNLTLSDRRAETVARILVEAYNVPAENLVTEGYGEQYLKVKTEGDERENRRVTIRNISPLLKTAEK